MLTRAIGCAIIGLGVSSSVAVSGHIEIEANIRNPSGGVSDLAGDMRLVFDTDTPPTVGANGRLIFEATHCDLGIPVENPVGVPFSVGVPNAQRTADYSIARLEYFPGSDVYQVTIARMLDGEFVEMSLVVEKPAGEFSAGMSSLPDSPEDFAFGGAGLDSVYVNLDVGADVEFAIWSTGSSFGAFSFSARTVDIADDSGCSAADMNGDGALNFFDVSVFLSLFAAGCP